MNTRLSDRSGSRPGVELHEPNGRSGLFSRHWKVKVGGLDPANSRRSGRERNFL